MSLSKQSKILSQHQINAVTGYLKDRRNGKRNVVIFLLSAKSGLRAKEIAHLRWSMIIGPDGSLSETIHLTDNATKGDSGRSIPINKDLYVALMEHFDSEFAHPNFNVEVDFVVKSERSKSTSAQVIVNMFQRWYRDLGLIGCSSHSGRRTFITNASRKIGLVGGSLRDVQMIAGHKNLQTTQRYIEQDTDSQRKVVNLV